MDLAKKMEQIAVAIKAKKNAVVKSDYDLMREKVVKDSNSQRRLQVIKTLLDKVPTIYGGKSFDDFKLDYPSQKTIKAIALRYVDTFHERKREGMNLVFAGPTGTGKTFLALIIYQALASQDVKVHYEANLQFLRALRDANFVGFASFKQMLNQYLAIDFLIIDEITAGLVKGKGLSAWENEMLFSLINLRYQANLCTLVITNRDIPQFKTQLTERIAGRLLGKSLVLAFDWPSYRYSGCN